MGKARNPQRLICLTSISLMLILSGCMGGDPTVSSVELESEAEPKTKFAKERPRLTLYSGVHNVGNASTKMRLRIVDTSLQPAKDSPIQIFAQDITE